MSRTVLAVSFFLLSGCTASRPAAKAPAPGSDPALAQALRAVEAGKQDYRIAPQDVLSISVYQEEDLKRDVRVSQTGKVTFPLVGEVALAGLSTMEAEARLRVLLKDYLVEPHVSVQVKDYYSRKVFILGEVMKPGSYEIPADHPLTVVESIALAGGFTKIAAPDKTRVVRKVAGEPRNFTVPVKQVTEGDKTKDIPLQPDDVVYVPQTFF